MDCIARFAVPSFFAISGYYAYRVDARKLLGRAVRIAKLEVACLAIFFGWECFARGFIRQKSVYKFIVQSFSVEKIARYIFMEEGAFRQFLWYLAAMLMVYIILTVYVRFWKTADEIDYKPLYILSVAGFLIHIVLSSKMLGVGLETHYMLYRNSLFFGMPMFAMGLFLREYGERIVSNYRITARKLWVLIVVGFALSILHREGIGQVEMPPPMLLTVVGFVLLLRLESDKTESPTRVGETAQIIIDKASMILFVIHPLVSSILKALARYYRLFLWLKEHQMIYPVAVLAISLLVSIVAGGFIAVINRNLGRR